MLTKPYLLHALSPLHAGTGQSADVIDLPIARMRSTQIPIVPGSSVKGVLRDARKPKLVESRWNAVFGQEGPDENLKHSGALIVGDARLLALPVRSFRGTFAWVTSPLLLALAYRDLQPCGISNLPAEKDLLLPMDERRALVARLDGPDASLNVHAAAEKRVYLEDLDLPVAAESKLGLWNTLLAPLVAPAGNVLLFSRRLVAVDDETMTFLLETATQVDTRVRLDDHTRTVAPGALWTEESLPPETLLLGLLAADKSRRQGEKMEPEDVLQVGIPEEEILQFGGKATVGRGRCRFVPMGVKR